MSQLESFKETQNALGVLCLCLMQWGKMLLKMSVTMVTE